MRLGVVVGRVSLLRCVPEMVGQRYVLAVPQSLADLAGQAAAGAAAEELTLVDGVGVGEGDLVGFSEGGEAAVPFTPDRKPVDAYAACLVDELNLDPATVARLLGRKP